MSRRRKHVRNQLEEACPELNEGDSVCRVVELRGGNQVEVNIVPHTHKHSPTMNGARQSRNLIRSPAAPAAAFFSPTFSTRELEKPLFAPRNPVPCRESHLATARCPANFTLAHASRQSLASDIPSLLAPLHVARPRPCCPTITNSFSFRIFFGKNSFVGAEIVNVSAHTIY